MRIDEIMNTQLKLELLRTIDKAIDKTIWNAYDSENGLDTMGNADANVAATTVKQATTPIAAQQQKSVKKLTPQQLSDIKTLNPQQLAQYIKTNLSVPTPAADNSKVPNKRFDTFNAKNTATKNKMDNDVEQHS